MTSEPDPIVIEYEDMTPEQKRIIDGGQVVAGSFPRGLSKAELSAWIMTLARLIAAGEAADRDFGEDLSDLTPEEIVTKLSS